MGWAMDDIASWASSISLDPSLDCVASQDDHENHKRKRACSGLRTPSPPMSSGRAPSTPSSAAGDKRKRARVSVDGEPAAPHDDAGVDAGDAVPAVVDTDATPRPVAFPLRVPSLLRESVSASTTGSSASRSGRSSPTKLLGRLALRTDGLQTLPLASHSPSLPPAVLSMLERMQKVSQTVKVVPRRFETLLAAERATSGRHIFQIDPWQWTDDNDHALAPDISLDTLLGVCDRAYDCAVTEASEAHWNHAVHSHILELAIGQVGRRRHPLLSVISCTNTSIFPSWHVSTAPGKKVDYCYVIDPYRPSELPHTRPDMASLLARIDETRVTPSRPNSSINHASEPFLEQRPVVLSVETKRADGRIDEAQLQMGVWLAAQWNSLTQLCGFDEAKVNALPFLPALIVSGHEWRWAAAAREGQKTVLYSSFLFGSTADIIGMFRVLAGIRLLLDYAQDVFLPWFEANILQPA